VLKLETKIGNPTKRISTVSPHLTLGLQCWKPQCKAKHHTKEHVSHNNKLQYPWVWP